MQKKILILVLFLAPVLFAQDEMSFTKKQTNTEKLTLISVTIGGDFIVNGSFPASFIERADQFITRIYNEARNVMLATVKDETTLAKINEQFTKYAKRDISLKRFSGEVIKVDLEKFRLTGDFNCNPYLKNDDVIIFPKMNIETNFISIEGAVNFPTKFQFVQGDKLNDAILMARGLNPAFDDVTEAEINRLDNTGNKEEILKTSLTNNIELKRGDRIRVLSDENNKKDFKVLILGEVKMPGYTFIKKGETSIREVIEKAGGFTKDAFSENAELLRGINNQQLLRMRYIKEQFDKNPELNYSKFNTKFNYQNLETMLMNRGADLTIEDSLALSVDNLLRLMQSPGIVDFTKIFDNSSKDGDFIVKDGDVILVPEKQDFVYLFGQINNGGYVQYEEGKNFLYYIEKAGGMGEAADGDVKLIKSKSRTWVDAEENTVINPGDFIYLPKKISHSWIYYLTQAGSVAGIVSALSTIVYFLFIAK
jgi:polysaccharide biosynthesis/export protein